MDDDLEALPPAHDRGRLLLRLQTRAQRATLHGAHLRIEPSASGITHSARSACRRCSRSGSSA